MTGSLDNVEGLRGRGSAPPWNILQNWCVGFPFISYSNKSKKSKACPPLGQTRLFLISSF